MNRPDYAFREGNERSCEGIEDLFLRHDYGPRRAKGWARWKYFDNPDGPSRLFVAERRDETIVGVLAYQPRRFTSPETGSFTVMRVVDLFVEPGLRRHGVFPTLLEFARSRMEVPKMGIPNDVSLVFASAPGWRDLAPYESWKFPVRVGALFAGRPLAAAADTASRVYGSVWLPGHPTDLQMRPIARFERDYVFESSVIHGVRSAPYLNWRFVDNPVRGYSLFEFVERDESVGYCVYARKGSCATLSDFVTARHRRRCLRLLVEHGREGHVSHLVFSGVGLRLGRLGFIRRGAGKCKAFGVPEGRWVVTPCDTDSEG